MRRAPLFSRLPSSLVPQRLGGMDLRGAPHGHPARQERDPNKQQSHNNQCRGIAGLHFNGCSPLIIWHNLWTVRFLSGFLALEV